MDSNDYKSPKADNISDGNSTNNQKSQLQLFYNKLGERKRYIENKLDYKTKPLQSFFRGIDTFINKHYVILFITMLTLCCIVNAIWFSNMDPNDPDNFAFNRTTRKKKDGNGDEFISNSTIDSLYFSFTTFSTVGYGDITPKSSLAKSWVTFVHCLVILFSYKLFEYYMNVDSNTNESALFATYDRVRNENIELKSKIADLEIQTQNKKSKASITPENVAKNWLDKLKKPNTPTLNSVVPFSQKLDTE